MKVELNNNLESDNLYTEDIQKRISLLEQQIIQNVGDGKKLSKQITIYFRDNLTVIHKSCKDDKHKKMINDLNTSQASILSDLKKLENHDQIEIQRCFEFINHYITNEFDMETGKVVQDNDFKPNQFDQDSFLNDIAKIKSIVSESKKQNDSYQNQVNSQLKAFKANGFLMIKRQSE